MKVNIFETAQNNLMKKALDAYGKKHNAIARNVAHASDPNYHPERVDFGQLLKTEIGASKIKTSDQKHIASSRFSEGEKSSEFVDEAVDLASEMAALAENQIRHEFVSQVLGGYYAKMKMAITGKM